MVKKALGRGLDALISQESGGTPARREEVVHMVPVDSIQPNPNQPRKQFDSERLEELAKSIGENGILEPLIVRPLERGAFELIAGERRLRAAQLAGQREVPALLRDCQGSESLEIALIENLQREDLNPIDEARAYQKLADDFGRTHAEISTEVGKDRSTVTNLLRLLKLPTEITEMVSRGTLSAGHARVLLTVEDHKSQATMAKLMVAEGWSVREAERRVSQTKMEHRGTRAETEKQHRRPAEILRVEDALKRKLGTDVRLHHTAHGGRVEIRYASNQELERLLEIIGVQVH